MSIDKLKALQAELGEDIFSFFLDNANSEATLDSAVIEHSKAAGFLTFEDMKTELRQKKIWQFFKRPNNDPYYHKKALSVSFLSHLERIDTNKDRFISNNYKPFAMGRAFEDMFTDCFNPQHYSDLTIEDLNEVRLWVDTAEADINVRTVYRDTTPKMQVEHWGVIDGLQWKCKTDAELSNEIFDLKTTSAKSEAEFLKSCERFGYYEQGWVYLELSGAKRFTLFGISKKVKKVFTVCLAKEDLQIGKEKIYEKLKLLDKYGIREHFRAA